MAVVDPNKAKRQLPGKESNLFKSIVRFYEDKQYKKGIKAADTILKKFPEHGETLAMKGLTLNCLGKKTEAFDLVRKGIKNDLTSHVCWHVYGLLYRSDQNYNEAIKCYKNALRNDKDNIQILRDLATLQVHLRDIDGFIETRRKILTLRPASRQNWIAFAVGEHLAGKYSSALRVLNEYESEMTTAPSEEMKPYEISEVLLYKNMIIEESGDLKGALEHLDKSEKKVVDKLALKEKRAELLLKLGRNEDAEHDYRNLLKLNADHRGYHNGLIASLGISKGGVVESEKLQNLLQLYGELDTTEEFKYSDTTKRIPLDYVSGDEFKTRLSSYVITRLRKGIPSLFTDLKALHRDSQKAEMIGDLFKSFETSLDNSGKFPDSSKVESPQTLFWTKMFLAQHYDIMGDTEMALKSIDDAISHTPTALECYSVKGKILKHAGDLFQASQLYEKARELDLADRYLNTKAARHLIRADQMEQALKVLGLFTKEGEEPENYLVDMQAMWFEFESGESYFRRQEPGLGLKRLTAIEKHFADITEDQFDFHQYCLRKSTLRSYIHTLRLEDKLHGHPYFKRGAKALIRHYIDLHDNPPVDEEKVEQEKLAAMSQDERKAYRAQKNKEAKKEEKRKQAAAEAAAAEKANEKKDPKKPQADAEPKKVDPDPLGKELLMAPDKLTLASKLITTLQKDAANDLEVQLLACDVALRRKKYILALKALKKAIALSPAGAEVHRRKVRYFAIVSPLLEKTEGDGSLTSAVREVIKAEQADILNGASLSQVNDSYLSLHKLSLDARVAGAEMMHFLDNSKKSEAISLITNMDNLKGIHDLKGCINNYGVLAKSLGDQQAAENYRIACRERFPHCNFFMTPDEKKAHADRLDQLKQQQMKEKEESSTNESKPSDGKK